MSEHAGELLLSLGGDGRSLRIRSIGLYAPKAVVPEQRAWQTVLIEVVATPFRGVIEIVLSQEDIVEWRNAILDFAVTGHATLGGGRAPEIRLETDGPFIEVLVASTGDDPWPRVAYLVPRPSSDTAER